MTDIGRRDIQELLSRYTRQTISGQLQVAEVISPTQFAVQYVTPLGVIPNFSEAGALQFAGALVEWVSGPLSGLNPPNTTPIGITEPTVIQTPQVIRPDIPPNTNGYGRVVSQIATVASTGTPVRTVITLVDGVPTLPNVGDTFVIYQPPLPSVQVTSGSVTVSGTVDATIVASSVNMPITGNVTVTAGALDANIIATSVNIPITGTVVATFPSAQNVNLVSATTPITVENVAGGSLTVAGEINTTITGSDVTIDTNAGVTNAFIGSNPLVSFGEQTASVTVDANAGIYWNFYSDAPPVLADLLVLAITSIPSGITIQLVQQGLYANEFNNTFVNTFTGNPVDLSTTNMANVFMVDLSQSPCQVLPMNSIALLISNSTSSAITFDLQIQMYLRYASQLVANEPSNPVNTAAIANQATYFSIQPNPTSTTTSQTFNLNPSGGTLLAVVFTNDSPWLTPGDTVVYDGYSFELLTLELLNGSQSVAISNLSGTGFSGLPNYVLSFAEIPNEGLNLTFGLGASQSTTASNTGPFTGYVVTR